MCATLRSGPSRKTFSVQFYSSFPFLLARCKGCSRGLETLKNFRASRLMDPGSLTKPSHQSHLPNSCNEVLHEWEIIIIILLKPQRFSSCQLKQLAIPTNTEHLPVRLSMCNSFCFQMSLLIHSGPATILYVNFVWFRQRQFW